MAALPKPDQGADLRRGVRQMVPAHRPARIRRNDAASARAQRQLRLPDREKLHPVPASDHLAALRPADAAPLRRAQSRGAETGHWNRFDGHLALRYAERYGKYKKSFHHSRPQKGANRPAAQSELHLLDLHRGGVQPAGAVGRHNRSATKCCSVIPSCKCSTCR